MSHLILNQAQEWQTLPLTVKVDVSTIKNADHRYYQKQVRVHETLEDYNFKFVLVNVYISLLAKSVWTPCVSLRCVSICLCNTCLCVCFYWHSHSSNIITWQLPMWLCGLIHWARVWGLAQKGELSIKLEVSRRWPEADSFPICKLSVFIYLLLNDLRFKPKGAFFSLSEKETTTQTFFLLVICHWPIKVKDWTNFEWKVWSTLLMDAFESLPFNTNKCLCHHCPLRHTF